MKQKDFVITAALPLQPASSASQIREDVRTLAPVVDAIQLNDDPYALGHMSPLAAASLVMQNGIDAIPHMSCRDRNRIAVQADMLGAAAMGITTLILFRGEKLADNTTLRAKGVFHLNETQLIRLAQLIGGDRQLVPDPGFNIGSCITVFKPEKHWEARRIQEKIDAGVNFLQTQPCLNAGLLRRYMRRLVERKIMHRASVLVEVPLVTSRQEAKTIKTRYKGATIPVSVAKRIVQAADPVAEGITICAEVIAELRSIPGVSGVNIRHEGAPQTTVSAIQQVLATSGALRP